MSATGPESRGDQDRANWLLALQPLDAVNWASASFTPDCDPPPTPRPTAAVPVQQGLAAALLNLLHGNTEDSSDKQQSGPPSETSSTETVIPIPPRPLLNKAAIGFLQLLNGAQKGGTRTHGSRHVFYGGFWHRWWIEKRGAFEYYPSGEGWGERLRELREGERRDEEGVGDQEDEGVELSIQIVSDID